MIVKRYLGFGNCYDDNWLDRREWIGGGVDEWDRGIGWKDRSFEGVIC